MSKLLACKLEIGVGISSGANRLGAILMNEEIENGTVFADDNKKYLSTDLGKEIEEKDYFISNKIKLIGFVETQITERVCIIFLCYGIIII